MCKHRYRYESIIQNASADLLERECLRCGLRQIGFFVDGDPDDNNFSILETTTEPKENVDYAVDGRESFY